MLWLGLPGLGGSVAVVGAAVVLVVLLLWSGLPGLGGHVAVVGAFNQQWIEKWVANGWKRGKSGSVRNIDLWKRLLAASCAHVVTYEWIKGHNGHPENERCDKLATTAADSENLIEDDGYED